MKFYYAHYKGKKIPIAPSSMTDREAAIFADENEIYRKIYLRQIARKEKWEDKLKVGTWIYCKYCYKNTHPVINWWDGLIKCGTCDYGLYPIQSDGDIEAWISNYNNNNKKEKEGK